MASPVVENALQWLRAEYLETPELRLTPGEAAELVGLDRPTSLAILQALEDSGFLRLSPDGRFALAPRGETPARPGSPGSKPAACYRR